MTEAEQIMKRCRVGTSNYNEANNLHAECYRVIGKLLKTIKELESQEPVAQPASEEDMKIYRAIADNYRKELTHPPQRKEEKST